jgi:hypothetical protein
MKSLLTLASPAAAAILCASLVAAQLGGQRRLVTGKTTKEKSMLNLRLVPVLLVLLLAAAAGPALAGGFPASCPGTYLIQEDGGARDFWTFAADGTFFGTTSTQPLFNFSNQQGSWQRVGGQGAEGVLLAFIFDDNDELLQLARIDIDWATTGQGCGEIAGSLEVRLYEPVEDPLGPDALDVPPAFLDTFTGRRVTVTGPG